MGKEIMTKVHHVALFVADMDRARYLFQDILGFDLAWHAPMVKGNRMAALLGIPDVKMEIAYLRSRPDGVAVELGRMIHPVMEKQSSSFGSPGTASLSLQVKKLDQLHQRLSREGWLPFSPCLDMPDPAGHPVRLFCFPMEEGMVVELIEKPSNQEN
jgi:catechol 2,3-dioxygenase-like lactoylglutathione lyase family enzyme